MESGMTGEPSSHFLLSCVMEELKVALTNKLHAVMTGCSNAKVMNEGVVKSHLLHKAR